jgi:predicted amidophosphoribosyltransferase
MMSLGQQRTCCICGADVAGKYAQYCDHCRAKARRKPLKYVFSFGVSQSRISDVLSGRKLFVFR